MTKILLQVARQLALDASQEVMRFFQKPDDQLKKERKEDRSIVTEADRRADALIRDGLLKAFPEHAVLTEENGLVGSTKSEFVWLIDPLDGTKAFAKGIPGFSVMIGLLKEGVPYLGVVVEPLEDHIYEAVKGEGAFDYHQGQKTPLHVSDRNDFSKMPLVVSTGFPEEVMEKLKKSFSGPQLPPINSVGVKAGIVARQEADIYLSHHSVSLWDTCAPQVIIEEAGGMMTRLNGSPLEYHFRHPYSHESLILVSNGRRHRDLISIFDSIFED